MRMTATRDHSGNSFSVEMDQEQKSEEGASLSGWGFPSSEKMKKGESASDQAQREHEECQGAHFNYAHFGVSFPAVN